MDNEFQLVIWTNQYFEPKRKHYKDLTMKEHQEYYLGTLILTREQKYGTVREN